MTITFGRTSSQLRAMIRTLAPKLMRNKEQTKCFQLMITDNELYFSSGLIRRTTSHRIIGVVRQTTSQRLN